MEENNGNRQNKQDDRLALLEQHIIKEEIWQREQTDWQKEMGKKVNEMYSAYTSASWSVKMLLYIFTALGIITGGIIGAIELIKRLK